ILVVGVTVLIGLISLGPQVGRGQSPKPDKNSRVKPTVMITDARAAAAAPSFADAAVLNSTLQSDLTWIFGKKEQRGWYLYNLLIQETIDTQAPPDSNSFASALGAWQKKTG